MDQEKIEELIEEKVEERTKELRKEVDILKSRLDHETEYTEAVGENVEDLVDEWDTYKSVMINSTAATSLTVAEKLLNGATWDNVKYTRTENRVRAMDVIANWLRYSQRTTRGRKLNVSKIQNILEDVDNYQTAKRTAEQVSKLTAGKIEINSTNNVGNILEQDNNSRLVRDIDNLF